MSYQKPPTAVVAKDVNGGIHEIATSQLRWRPSVYGFILRDDSILVIPQRNGRYDVPGGGVEFGEQLEDALLREVYEETGLKTTRPKLVQVETSFFKMPDKPDDFIQSLMMYYTLEIESGEISTIGFDEYERLHLEKARWLKLDELGTIELTSSIDWRPFALRAAGR